MIPNHRKLTASLGEKRKRYSSEWINERKIWERNETLKE